jgi:hypothetical protein
MTVRYTSFQPFPGVRVKNMGEQGGLTVVHVRIPELRIMYGNIIERK